MSLNQRKAARLSGADVIEASKRWAAPCRFIDQALCTPGPPSPTQHLAHIVARKWSTVRIPEYNIIHAHAHTHSLSQSVSVSIVFYRVLQYAKMHNPWKIDFKKNLQTST